MHTTERLNRIYGKTDGQCTHCDKQLAWVNYGQPGSRGAWEVDHSRPLSRGGSHHLNNLVPACVACNRAKGDMTAREFRMEIAEPQAGGSGAGWGALLAAGAVALGLLILSGGRAGGRPPSLPRGGSGGLR